MVIIFVCYEEMLQSDTSNKKIMCHKFSHPDLAYTLLHLNFNMFNV